MCWFRLSLKQLSAVPQTTARRICNTGHVIVRFLLGTWVWCSTETDYSENKMLTLGSIPAVCYRRLPNYSNNNYRLAQWRAWWRGNSLQFFTVQTCKRQPPETKLYNSLINCTVLIMTDTIPVTWNRVWSYFTRCLVLNILYPTYRDFWDAYITDAPRHKNNTKDRANKCIALSR